MQRLVVDHPSCNRCGGYLIEEYDPKFREVEIVCINCGEWNAQSKYRWRVGLVN